MRSLARLLVVTLATAQFGTIKIDWTSEQDSDDGLQMPVVDKLDHDFEGDLQAQQSVAELLQDAAALRRLKLLAERERVAALTDGRSANHLWEHWFGEEGEDAQIALESAAQVLDEPDSAGEAPALLELIERFPTWAEPINRLATLRFLQRRFAESVELCERVLVLKPWHFGALSGIVMCHSELGNSEAASRWAAIMLPERFSASTTEGAAERKRWVARNLEIIDGRLARMAENAET